MIYKDCTLWLRWDCLCVFFPISIVVTNHGSLNDYIYREGIPCLNEDVFFFIVLATTIMVLIQAPYLIFIRECTSGLRAGVVHTFSS